MAKSKKTSWDESSTQAYLNGQFNARAIGADATDAGTLAASSIGLRLPHLSQRILFQRTTLPFERTLVIYGPTGANKSTLLYEFYRLFWKNSGKYFHLDVEDKDTPVLRLSLTGYDRTAGDSRPCVTLTEYQEEVESYINWYAQLCSKADGPGKVCPVAIGIDSLVAKMTADAAERVRKDDGRTERRFADEARALSDWFKYIPSKLHGLPICLFGVNHDKPKTDQHTGRTIHNSPGGSAPNYYATYKIFAERVARIPQGSDGFEGNRIKLTMHKNSLGADNQSVEVAIVWRTVAAKSVSGLQTTRQETLWNWHKATVEHLYRLQGVDGGKKAGRRGDAVNDLLRIRKHTGGRYSSAPLGIGADDAISPYKLGGLIEKAEGVLAELEPLLGIHPSFAFHPGVDYDKQTADAVAAADDLFPSEPPPAEPLDDEGDESDGE